MRVFFVEKGARGVKGIKGVRGVKGDKGVKVLSQFVLGTNFRTHEGRGFGCEGGGREWQKALHTGRLYIIESNPKAYLLYILYTIEWNFKQIRVRYTRKSLRSILSYVRSDLSKCNAAIAA